MKERIKKFFIGIFWGIMVCLMLAVLATLIIFGIQFIAVFVGPGLATIIVFTATITIMSGLIFTLD